MTMHLVGPYMTTTNYRKTKSKPRTKAQQAQFELAHKAYNKGLRQIGCHDQQLTLEDYDLYCRGQYKPKPRKQEKEVKLYEAPEPYVRNTTSYPSRKTASIPGACAKREPQRYTGTLIKGIATMHKSNAVPVIDQQQAIDISNMRR
jgi:hypothetical protein